ncbi:hypothetical protein NDU88_004418 [Pleurodeles waltl]|uniref:Eukaryotic translation initiation factor 3 subunit J n=1 Tax=Pleurodeles waltl TaxID=8319 RepID=A0AAV7TRG4_PLEWA|nr:hypothetical protein NDU88_004418 [Pleurodeles waltl]
MTVRLRGTQSVRLTHTPRGQEQAARKMAEPDTWDADEFEPVPEVSGVATGPVVADRWAGEDEEEEVKDNWDDEEEEGAEDSKKEAEKTDAKVSEKKKLQEKIKEKESKLKKKQEEMQKLEEPKPELTPEEQVAEKLRLKKLQEESDLELAKEAFGDCAVSGIDAINPTSKEDFAEFGRLLKEKITHYEKSLHYTNFLETLLRDVCISLEVEDLKKISNSLTVLYSEKQKQEKNKAKKKKKGVLPGGGFKANMKDDLADYGGFDAGYAREYEDFM